MGPCTYSKCKNFNFDKNPKNFERRQVSIITGSAFSWVKYESLRLAIKVRPFGSNQNKWREIFNILIEVYDLWNLIEEPSSHFDKACQQKCLYRVLKKFWVILKIKIWVHGVDGLVDISWFKYHSDFTLNQFLEF